MSRSIVVADASPPVGLQRVGQLELLSDLFGDIIAPPAVMEEFARKAQPPSWLVERRLSGASESQIRRAPLGPGETEAIALAAELSAEWLILDDEAGRRRATALGLPVIGTLGLLLLAKQQGLIAAVLPLVEALEAAHFHLAPHLVGRVLAEAGEAAINP